MSYYNTFIKTTSEPKEYYDSMLQELVDYQFDNASSHYVDVEEEVEFGTLKFKNCKVRVNTLVDTKTGQRVNDDFKKLIFKDLKYAPTLGTRFKFNDNIWIAFSKDNLKTASSSVYVRRCNNTINTQDEYGNIHREPCIIEYSVTEVQLGTNESIDVPNSRILVKCQHNSKTNIIDINDRFIFGGASYKVKEFHRFDKTTTLGDNSPIISFYAGYDGIADFDELNLDIANYRSDKYYIETPSIVNCLENDEGSIDYTVFFDGKVCNEKVVFDNSDISIAYIDTDGNYIANKLGECIINVRLRHNPSVYTPINFIVSETIEDTYYNKIYPDVSNIKLNCTQLYEVYEYINDVKQETEFSISCTGVLNKNYYFESTGNSFSISNLKTSDDLLNISCINQRTDEEINIFVKLGGVF